MPKVSIIVPVYNVAEWLPRCLDSLIGQTLTDIEIICIDDKSTDASLAILQDYAKKDNRVKVFALTQNGGASVARNQGLAAATGEYLGFVDSDDYIDLDFYEKLYTAATSAGADIAKGNALEVQGDIERPWGAKAEDIKRNKHYFVDAWWSAIYRCSMVRAHSLYFHNITVGEDLVFLLKAVHFANSVKLIDNANYYYIRRNNSLDSQILSTEKIKSSIAGLSLMIGFCNDHIADLDSYSILYRHWINLLFDNIIFRHRTYEIAAQTEFIQSAISFWQRCKFKEIVAKGMDSQYVSWLENGNEIALLQDIMLLQRRGEKRYSLFNCIPLLSIKYGHRAVSVHLFGFIPLLKIRNKKSVLHYRLFFAIPLMKRVVYA